MTLNQLWFHFSFLLLSFWLSISCDSDSAFCFSASDSQSAVITLQLSNFLSSESHFLLNPWIVTHTGQLFHCCNITCRLMTVCLTFWKWILGSESIPTFWLVVVVSRGGLDHPSPFFFAFLRLKLSFTFTGRTHAEKYDLLCFRVYLHLQRDFLRLAWITCNAWVDLSWVELSWIPALSWVPLIDHVLVIWALWQCGMSEKLN